MQREKGKDKAATRPKTVVLCGSSRYCDVMAVCAWLIEKQEDAVTMGLHLLPIWYPATPDGHQAEIEGVSKKMDALHLKKIDMCDEIFVVDFRGYIGESTANEISYAQKHGKPIRRYSDDPVGRSVQEIIDKWLAEYDGKREEKP